MSFFHYLSENWELVCIAFGVFVNAVGLFYNVVKYLRRGGVRRVENLLALAQKARDLACEAEELEHASGPEKLEYALSRLRQYAKEVGEGADEEELVAMLEEEIAFSKRVNADKSEVLE